MCKLDLVRVLKYKYFARCGLLLCSCCALCHYLQAAAGPEGLPAGKEDKLQLAVAALALLMAALTKTPHFCFMKGQILKQQ